MKILLDTNFLIDITKFKVDLESINELVQEAYTLATLDLVVRELTKLSKGKTKVSKNAKLALRIIKEYKIKILKSKEKNVDKALLEFARNTVIIATNDRRVRKEIKALGKKTIYLKSKKHLAIG